MKKNILLLITNLGKGGAQKVFFDHSLTLSTEYNIIEAVFDINEDKRLYDSGLPLFDLSVKKKFSYLPGPLGRLFTRAYALRQLVNTQKSELIISHMDGANWVNVLSKTNAKKILVVHGTVLHDNGQSKLMRWLRKKIIIPYIYNKADITIAVSDGIVNELKTYCGVKNIKSIPNFFDIDLIKKQAEVPLPESYEAIFRQSPVLITSGRFSEQKKQRFLLPVFKEIKQHVPDAKLFLLGDGELRKDLINRATTMGFKIYHSFDNSVPFHEHYDIYMPGYVTNPYQYLKKSTLFLFPSGWEGFPMALCEAMISGVPVLSTDCPTGPRQILSPGSYDNNYQLHKSEWTPNGYLMPMPDQPGFRTEWVNTILELLEDEQKRQKMVAQATERMKSFDKPVVIAAWKKTIEEVLNPL